MTLLGAVLAAGVFMMGTTGFGSPRLPLAVETLEGKPVLLGPAADQRGLVVHFWATWCPPCLEELPALDRAARACRGTRTRVVAVSVEDDVDSVEEFVRSHRITLDVFHDPEGRAFASHPGRQLPANLIWQPVGMRASTGPLGVSAWRNLLADLGCGDGAEAEGSLP